MKLIVGLGNPGYEYHLTPHNLGFMVVDLLAERCAVEIGRPEAGALTAVARLENEDVILAKPQTYMNLSGAAVARLLQKYELQTRDVVLVVDEAALPLGALRIRTRGSAGSHNGLKSVIGALQSDEFVRVRLGCQPGHLVRNLAGYVLGRFRKAELEAVAGMVERAADAVAAIVKDGPQSAMNRFNQRLASPEL